MNKYLSLLFFCLVSFSAFSQLINYTGNITNTMKQPWALDLGYQYNSKEQIGSLHYENFQNKGSWNLGFTYNFGMGNDKHNCGWGLSAGYRYNYQNSLSSSVFTGANVSLLFNNSKAGKETAFRPALELGYQGVVSNHYLFEPGLTYGFGIDLSKEKEKPKDFAGGRFFPGVAVGYRF